MLAWAKALLCNTVLLLSVPLVYGLTVHSRFNTSPLAPRQIDPSAVPSQCSDACAPLFAQVSKCSPDGNLANINPQCICTDSLTGNLNTCVSCIKSADPNNSLLAQIQQLQPLLNQFCPSSSNTASTNGTSSPSGDSGKASSTAPASATGSPKPNAGSRVLWSGIFAISAASLQAYMLV